MPDDARTQPSVGLRFRAACACLLLFVVLNCAFYLLVSTEAYQTIGFPWRFYYQSGDYSRFRVIHFIMDLGLALYCSYKAGDVVGVTLLE